MESIPELLAKVSKLTPHKVSYPEKLLAKHNLDLPLDKEVLNYLVEGGEAGAYYHWLTLLVQQSDAKLIVELGNRYGTSTLALFHGLKKGQKLISLDVIKDQRFVTSEIFDSPQVKFAFGDCLDLNVYPANNMSIPLDIEIFFTDTVHNYEQIKSEFEVYEPLLANEALVIIDDINVGDKRKFWDELTTHEKYDLTAICHGSGFGVIHYVRPEAERTKTQEQRVETAQSRSISVWKNRFMKLNNQPPLLSKRLKEIRKKKRNASIQRILFKLTGKRFGCVENHAYSDIYS